VPIELANPVLQYWSEATMNWADQAGEQTDSADLYDFL